MTPDQRIKKLEEQLETVKNENHRLKGTFKYQIENPKEWHYIQYLRESLSNLEFLYDQQNEVLQKHIDLCTKQQHVLSTFNVITSRNVL